ncbi:MAG: patatin-like phospholipase family protein, partial [Rhizobacter sp.]|nr:patatin-like phospholipase family protein [Rhizobacter sp.]
MKNGCIALALAWMLSACTSYGVVKNTPITTAPASHPYGIKDWQKSANNSGDLWLMLAFSGGGTRAAALSYGVLKALRDTTFQLHGRPVRLLDEVDLISSVSGGSFTAAFYGLHGEAIFAEFEGTFLRRDIQTSLIDLVLNPFMWFGSTGRTEWAINYYEDNIFHGATFADMVRPDRPFILINASDLGYGVRFSFIQEYFGLLCSDLSTFPVARAVAASSAVPLLFNPVVVQNYADCNPDATGWLQAARQRAAGQAQATQLLDRVATYLDKDKRKYAHFVDGGITDNLGLRAILDIVNVQGGLDALFEALKVNAPRHIVIISVNAATDPEPDMDRSNKQPTLAE